MLQASEEVLKYFERRVIDALFNCVKSSMEALRRRIHGTARRFGLTTPQEDVGGGIDFSAARDFEVLFIADVELALPSVVIRPGLEDLQGAVNSAVLVRIACSNSHVLCCSLSSLEVSREDFHRQSVYN